MILAMIACALIGTLLRVMSKYFDPQYRPARYQDDYITDGEFALSNLYFFGGWGAWAAVIILAALYVL